MDWFVLGISGLFEAFWVIALANSDGFRRKLHTLLFILFGLASLVGLAFAMRTLPAGTSYAVWAGIGAAATVSLAIARKEESASWPRVLLIAALILSVAGLKAVS